MKNYKIELSAEEIQLIGDALTALPYRLVAKLVAKIDSQIVEQENGADNNAD